MKFITYILLAILGLVLGLAAYAVIEPMLPEKAAPAEELIGGKTKEQIAAEFLASLDEEGNPVDSKEYWLTQDGRVAFAASGWQIVQNTAEGMSQLSLFNPDVDSDKPALELTLKDAQGSTAYASFLEATVSPLVPASSCEPSSSGAIDKTCLYSYLESATCQTTSIGELDVECYDFTLSDGTVKEYLFGQTADFIYYAVTAVRSEGDATTKVLESIDFYPDDEVKSQAQIIQ